MQRVEGESIGDRISYLLRRKGKKQKDYAAYMGRVDSWVSHVKQGNISFTEEMLGMSADFFNTTTDYLLGRTDDPSPRSGIEEATYISPEADEIAGLVDGMGANWRKLVRQIARAIAEHIENEQTEQYENQMKMRDSLDAMLSYIENEHGLESRRRIERIIIERLLPGGFSGFD